MKKRAYIAGAGDFNADTLPRPGDFIIAADAGLTPLQENGFTPDCILGDFDSLDALPEGENVLRFPVMKDDTDMALAVAEGVRNGCTRFLLNGGLGGRLDHTLANLQMMRRMAESGLEVILTGPNENIAALHNGSFRFSAAGEGVISVFSVADRSEGVSIKGLLYRLEDGILTADRALGVSNEFIGREAEISVRSGTLIVVWHGPVELLIAD